jgi:3-deoxy-7-phosphoheptulonate synthase
VCEHVTQQWVQGSKHILGVMLESHLVEGQQKLSSTLAYGKSITDGCIGWETTETLLQKMYDQMKNS